MPTPILIIDKLHIGYGDKVVISDLSLEIHEGEFVALLGASGSGKSSVLRTLAGFHPVMSGRIILEGKDITIEPPERRNVGMVFQNYALFPTMTAFENIAFALRVAKIPQGEIVKRVTQIAETSGITEQLHKKPATMSGGQQQRVAIARAARRGLQGAFVRRTIVQSRRQGASDDAPRDQEAPAGIWLHGGLCHA
ncbi:ABC transporter ATP-binding protein [Rhizobium laguerreae]